MAGLTTPNAKAPAATAPPAIVPTSRPEAVFVLVPYVSLSLQPLVLE